MDELQCMHCGEEHVYITRNDCKFAGNWVNLVKGDATQRVTTTAKGIKTKSMLVSYDEHTLVELFYQCEICDRTSIMRVYEHAGLIRLVCEAWSHDVK